MHPLKLAPKLLTKIWGGRRLETVLGKKLPSAELYGESWELYDFPPGVISGAGEGKWESSQVSDGPMKGQTLHEVLQRHEVDVMGKAGVLMKTGQFPLLMKFLDARDDLSIQVHPNEAYARNHPGAYLKNEAWYVVGHEPGAVLYKDLEPGVTAERFRKALGDGTVADLVRQTKVKPGDCYYLPSGTVHALGAGILAAEVQTPSDTTYRVFDFNRIEEATGKPRKLHIEEAMACIDFDAQPFAQPAKSHAAGPFTTTTRLVSCDYFVWEKVRMAAGVELPIPYDHPVIWMMLEGCVEVSGDGVKIVANVGDTLLLPARMKQPVAKAMQNSVWLEATIPAK